MSTVIIPDEGMVRKNPNESRVFLFDWDTDNLAAGVLIITSVLTISAVKPSTTDAVLTKDSESILAGSRQTQLRLISGTLGQIYQITNHVTTNENPAQVKEKLFFLKIEM